MVILQGVSLVYSGGESRNIILEVHSKQVLETLLHKINISDSTWKCYFVRSAPDNLTRYVETLPINGTVGQDLQVEIQLQ
jgi:hypothetical protein